MNKRYPPEHIETAEEESLKLCGFDKKAWVGSKDLKEVLKSFILFSKECILIGHNIRFDLNFIEAAFKKYNLYPKYKKIPITLDSLAWPIVASEKIENLKLSTLCKYFKISNNNEHRALPDCHRTLKVYKKLMRLYGVE